MIRGIAAAASDPVAASAATEALEAGGSAVDAIVAGFFAAAGAHASVLLSPSVALVGGTGAGARAFDGRSLQPGRGAPRPRGFVRASEIPPAAYVDVPRSITMLSLVHTYLGRSKMRDLVRAGALAADERGAKKRAKLLRTIGSQGPLALRAEDVSRALVTMGGKVEGGILTADDLVEALPGEEAARADLFELKGTVLTPPWEPGGDPGATLAIVAVDARGTVAALAYAPSRGGLVIEELELSAGTSAIPVRRGVPRTPPGEVLAMPMPLAIVIPEGGSEVTRLALAMGGLMRIEAEDALAAASSVPVEEALATLRRERQASFAVGVAGQGVTVKAMTVTAEG